MKTSLTEAEKAELIPHILKVLETRVPWEDGKMHHPGKAIINAILEIPGVELPPLELDRDRIKDQIRWSWWHDFNYKGRKYTLLGSCYYGGHCFQLVGNDE